jgi:O-methyltransferase involved in polyketide biosynthesis
LFKEQLRERRVVSQGKSGSLPPVTVRLDTPSLARVYDYFLGGMTNWEVDRSFADQLLDQFPLMRRIAFAHRLFLNRVVRHLVGQGVCQFLDIGSGVPGTSATHAVADHKRPGSRVVFVDNDPVAVAHTELFLDREGDRQRHAVIDADLRAPEDLWQQALNTELLDPDQPVALLLIGLLHLRQPDADGVEVGPDCVAKLRELLPMGSYVAISHVSEEGMPDEARATLAGIKRAYRESGSYGIICRSHAEIESLLGDYRMVAPGWTAAVDWRPEETGPSAPAVSFPPGCNEIIWAGVGRKP